ncbi:hypothetical protein ASZ90_017080 [hydrocarbon metagenome]|uniref:Uncharacterized protein n=1 Tax=hydrocarbon metagenome TaxID=938273 RepID=A0A0W8EA36_9ZZZZ
MKKTLFILLLVLGVLAFANGCGGEKTDVDNTGGKVIEQNRLFNPSELLTQEDAETILGEAVGDPDISESPVGTVCFYSPLAEGTQVRFVQLSLHQTEAFTDAMQNNGYTAAKLYDDSIALLEEVQPIDGLGDRAFWGGSGLKAGAGLHVLQGDDLYFTITVGLGNEADDLEASRDLAEQVLDRIK